MITYFIYLLNVNIGLVLLYLGYKFFLQKSRHFLGIRHYFLFGMVACLVFPFFQMESIGWWQHSILDTSIQQTTPVLTSVENSVNQTLQAEESHLSLFDAFIAVYLSVAFLLMTYLLYRITKLYCLIKQSKLAEGKSFRINPLTIKNFTFLQYVVLGNGWTKLSENEKAYVLAHENHHVNGLHSIDILLFHVIQAFCWFNPVVWILGKSISLNHEFLVDDQMIQKGISIEEYASLLIDESVPEQAYPIFQSFSQFSNLKKRINMMTELKSKSRKRSIWLAVPILTTILFACNLTDVNDNTLSADSILAEGDELAFLFEDSRINLKQGISKEQLSNNRDDVFRLVLKEENRKNLKSVSLTVAKGHRAIGGEFKLDENYLRDASPEDIQFNLTNLGISDSIKAEGIYRLIIVMEIVSPGFNPEFYKKLKIAKKENRFSPYTDEEIRERHLALTVDFVNAFAKLRTEEDARAFATDVVNHYIYTIRIE